MRVLPRAAGGVDHEVDYFVADATFLKIDDLGCVQVIHRLGTADVAEDNFVAEAGTGQRLYVRDSCGLSRTPE